ncbi:sialin-like isoform X3 [Schistocerca serialis cubense]|uniref:sialin-like isoform X3 n=1 Tax=Schistocerca serialis cubense TaxID=2023355 RepID=UPI00214EF0EC|nr:sialin-like isoform X3 [Schistocerca serialis cubense]
MTTTVTTAARDRAGFWKTRYTMLLLNTLGLAICNTTRVNISVAIVDMVNGTALRERVAVDGGAVFHDPDACPGEQVLEGPSGRKDGEFIWDTQMQGEILAGFYYGYTLGHIPGGVLADRFGGKVVLLFSVLVSSLLAILTPLSAWAGYYALFMNRFCQGLAQGGTIPAIQTTVCTWAPDHERSLFSLIFLGMFIGNLVSMAVTGALCETVIGWPLSFYVFGGVGILWSVSWFLQAADSPAQHPYIDPVERSYIEATIKSAAKNGIISAVPHMTGAAGSVAFVWFTNFLLRKEFVSKIWTFRIINALGTLVPAVALVVVALVGCDSATIIAMLAISGFCTATDCTGSYLNMQIIAPNYAGTIVGIVNMFANLTGIAVPYVVGAFTNDNPTRAAWNTVFYLSAAVATVSYVVYAVFTTTEEQPWNVPASERAHKANVNEGIENTAFDEGVTQIADRQTTQKGHWKAIVP